MQKPTLKQRFQDLLANYGKIAIVIYFSSFALSMLGFSLAFRLGVQPQDVRLQSVSGTAGTLAMAYAATQLIKPLRIFGTLALTPVVARLLRRKPAEQVEGEAPSRS